MNVKHALLVSVALNLVALATVLRLLPKRSEPPVTGDGTVVQRESNGPAVWRAAQKLVRNEPAVALDWRHVESEDYREYIANLRAIGCPEKTIRDIILADVKELFASRCSQVLATNVPTQFWRSNNQMNLSEEQRKQLQELAAKQREVLRLLGTERYKRYARGENVGIWEVNGRHDPSYLPRAVPQISHEFRQELERNQFAKVL